MGPSYVLAGCESSVMGPIVQMENLDMEASDLPTVTQLEYGKAGLQARQSGFSADIRNYMLEEIPSGNLNQDFFSPFHHILSAGHGGQGPV